MTAPIDPKAFEKLRRIAEGQLAARRTPEDWRAASLPEEVAFKLTNRCDLRCTHCYQWGDEGYHRSLLGPDRGRDLPLAVIARVLEATREVGSNLYLWGGEPLVYRDWDGLVDLLAEHGRWTTICTNGTMIERRLTSLQRISSVVEMSISIDGFAAEHDAVRGAGAFARTLAGLRMLLESRRAGAYRGEITVNLVISDAMIPRLFEFVAFLEAEGVETVFLSFPWFIAETTAAMMDGYVAAHLPAVRVAERASWDSFSFRVDPERLDDLRAELARIDAASWRLKLRYNPALSPEDLDEFIRGSHRPAQNKTRCLALRTRLDVFPNADVVSCKFFPEFTVGNLATQSVAEVWHGARYDDVRRTVATCGLMPACAKCNLLYARGA
jgi:radical SAM protein with 4Fe4S-binding SPASM domain